MYIVYNAVIIACECVIFSFSRPGGHHPNHEDEEEDQQCPAADGAGGDPKEHVSASEEDDQGADRVAHRAQVHKEGRGRHQHLHLHGLGSERGSAFLLCFLLLAYEWRLKNLQEERDEEQKDVFEEKERGDDEWGVC